MLTSSWTPSRRTEAALNRGVVLTNEPPGDYGFVVHGNAGATNSGLSAWGVDVDLPPPTSTG